MSVYKSSLNDSIGKHSGDENDAEVLDPRIQVELERLNKACADVNKMENELEEAKSLFFTSKNRQLQRLEYLQKKLGSCISKSKPYYEALELTEKFQIETQRAVHEFQKANSLYKTAKETLSVAENSLEKGEIPDAWQEHLSSTVTKINQSKKAADQAEENHRNKAVEYQLAEQRLQYLEKDLKRQIIKSELYYREKRNWNVQMEAQKMRIHDLEQALIQTKSNYKEAMVNLSKISEEIHNKRKIERKIKDLPPREPCVGAEQPNAFNFDEKTNESHNESKHNQTQLENYLSLYKLSLPDPKQNSPPRKNDANNDYFEKQMSLEYVSLGLNSTVSNSNSRCSTPSSSNSLENGDIKENTELNLDETLKNLDKLSTSSLHQSSSFTESSLHKEFGQYKQATKTPKRGFTEDLRSSSFAFKQNVKEEEKYVDFQRLKNETERKKNEESMFKTPKTSDLSSSNKINLSESKKSNKVSNSKETPLLSNLLMHHSKY